MKELRERIIDEIVPETSLDHPHSVASRILDRVNQGLVAQGLPETTRPTVGKYLTKRSSA